MPKACFQHDAHRGPRAKQNRAPGVGTALLAQPVILGLVPRIHRSAGSGVRGTLDPRNPGLRRARQVRGDRWDWNGGSFIPI